MTLPTDFDLSKFDNCRLLVVGDLMIDEYVWGNVDRISPEAPVQVVAVNSEDYTLGGSGNVVNNLVALGAGVSVLGVVGSGRYGRQLLDRLSALGSNTGGIIQEAGRPTTQKTRIIAAHQQVLRIDRETKKNVAAETLASIIASA
jgi:D-beta-D-heptose 7-phosphate kinase/D-beta-D-heptose 1-phosphate adenosyltransferase